MVGSSAISNNNTSNRLKFDLRRRTWIATLGRTLTLALAFAGCQTTQAGRFDPFKDSAISELSKEEFQMLKARTRQVLDTQSDLSTDIWLSPESNIKVSIKPLLTYAQNDQKCRRTAYKLLAPKGMPEYYRFNICQNADGQWQITSPPQPHHDESDVQLLKQNLDYAYTDYDVGHPMTWVSPVSDLAVTIVVLDKYRKAKEDCATATVSITDKHKVTLEGQYDFCKSSEGWYRTAGKAAG